MSAILDRKELRDRTAIDLCTLFAMQSKFREAEKLIRDISIQTLPKEDRPAYYLTYKTFLEYYSGNNYAAYQERIDFYQQKYLSELDPSSVPYQVTAESLITTRQFEKAKVILLSLLNGRPDKNAYYALINYLLGNLYSHDRAKAKKYYTLSAIADIKNATKDNASLQKLATIYYAEGDLDTAYLLTKCALEDAIFSNVNFRVLQISEFNEEITLAYQRKQKKQQEQLTISLCTISILGLIALASSIVIWRQKRSVSRISQKLSIANDDLNIHISHLAEANHIKEIYITQFFERNSTHIDTLVHYRKQLLKKAAAQKMDELFKQLKSDDLEKRELESLYRTFDSVFLSLYPDFVASFNALLTEEYAAVPKQGELLSPQLRVFALIRLGIADSSKIASFLRYSLSTVYNYRTKGRNMASGSREKFEQAIMQIKGLY